MIQSKINKNKYKLISMTARTDFAFQSSCAEQNPLPKGSGNFCTITTTQSNGVSLEF
jgi:hypothetical protein